MKRSIGVTVSQAYALRSAIRDVDYRAGSFGRRIYERNKSPTMAITGIAMRLGRESSRRDNVSSSYRHDKKSFHVCIECVSSRKIEIVQE